MNYEEVLEFMFNSLPMYQRIGQAAYKSDLNNTLELDAYFNFPHKNFRTIHVAGTNGKGSVSHSLASILQEAGYKTGLYTSPHLVDFRERIRVNGEMITKDFVSNFINNNKDIIKKTSPSFFEMSVAMAFEYFNSTKIDIAVVEVGMGGRLDSTNIINPELAIITNIGFDHTQFLGNSLDKIALEKAGIIKHNIPVIIGETQKETQKVFEEITKSKNSALYFADQKINTQLIDEQNGIFRVNEICDTYNLHFELSGKYQEKNLATILMSIEILLQNGFKITHKNIENGLSKVKTNTGLRGRWDIIGHSPLIICDTGHNKEGLKYVIKQILSQQYEKLHLILGFVNDKNVSEILKLFPKNALYYFAQANIPRAMNVQELSKIAESQNLKGNAFVSVLEAYQSALRNTSDTDMIFIGGSTFIVGDLFANMCNLE
jgi:dihydrofolate synthase/folylpolyglutamate synthase